MSGINIGLLFLFVASLQSTSAIYGKPIYDLNFAPELFIKFIQNYNRHYKDTYSLLLHYEAFKYALRDINENNSNPSSATFEINQFTDYTPKEWQKLNSVHYY